MPIRCSFICNWISVWCCKSMLRLLRIRIELSLLLRWKLLAKINIFRLIVGLTLLNIRCQLTFVEAWHREINMAKTVCKRIESLLCFQILNRHCPLYLIVADSVVFVFVCRQGELKNGFAICHETSSWVIFALPVLAVNDQASFFFFWLIGLEYLSSCQLDCIYEEVAAKKEQD